MAITYRSRGMLPIIALGATSFLAGGLLFGSVVSHFAEARESAAARQTATVKARIGLLESVLRKQADTSVSFSSLPEAGEEVAEAGASSVAQSTQPAAPVPTAAQSTVATVTVPSNRADRAAPAPRRERTVRAPETQAVAQAPSALPAPVVATRAQRPAQQPAQASDPLPRPVSPEALAAAKLNNKIEGVTSEKAGIAKIDTSGVTMRSGGKVAVGGRFPSGERLLSVDPSTGQVITDSRTVLLMDSN